MDFLTQIPMTYQSCAIITFVVWLAYAIFLYHITGRNRSSDKLIGAFAIIALLGFAYHIWLFSIIAHGSFMQYDNLISRILFSVQYSLEMFLANTIIFKLDIPKVFENKDLMFHSYLIIYGMAILTSGFSIFHFLSRRFYNWFWLTFHRSTIKTHIFIGVNDASRCLAKDMMTNIEKKRKIHINGKIQTNS